MQIPTRTSSKRPRDLEAEADALDAEIETLSKKLKPKGSFNSEYVIPMPLHSTVQPTDLIQQVLGYGGQHIRENVSEGTSEKANVT
jgi:hypothetical protein